MTDKDDILIKQFIQENRQKIPDNGFTEQVIRLLPEDSSKALPRQWTMLCCSVTLIVVLALLLTGHLNISLKIPEIAISILKDIQSPETVGQFLIGHLRYGILTWMVILAGALKFTYDQYKSAY